MLPVSLSQIVAEARMGIMHIDLNVNSLPIAAAIRYPRDVVPESIMPGYPWLEENKLDTEGITTNINVLRILGAPYADEEIAAAPAALEDKTELDALIAYLQGLGIELRTRRN